MSTPSAKGIGLYILAILAFALLCKCSTSYGAMTPQERLIVEQARSKIVELNDSLAAQQKANDSALAAQTLALTQISELTASAKIAAEAAAALTAERDHLQNTVAERDATIASQKADKTKLLASFHTFKFYTASVVGALVAGIVGLLIFRFAAPALNTLPGIAMAFGVPAAVGAAAFTLIITR